MKVWIKGGVHNGVPISPGAEVTKRDEENRRLADIIESSEWVKELSHKEIADRNKKLAEYESNVKKAMGTAQILEEPEEGDN